MDADVAAVVTDLSSEEVSETVAVSVTDYVTNAIADVANVVFGETEPSRLLFRAPSPLHSSKEKGLPIDYHVYLVSAVSQNWETTVRVGVEMLRVGGEV